MSRPVLTALAGIVAGASSWAAFGALAAMVGTKLPGGAREGAGAMAGFFFIGAIFGVIGAAGGGWIAWVVLSRAERGSAVAFTLLGVAAVLVAGIMIALRPTVVLPDDFPGKTAELAIEVSFPAAGIKGLNKTDRLEFEMRSADGTEPARWESNRIRYEAGRAVVPIVFATRTYPRSKLLAVMKNDQQVMCSTLTMEGATEAGTDWSEWQALESGLEARWRLTVSPKP